MGDGATRSRIEDGWHPNWERARRKEKEEDTGFENTKEFNVTSYAEKKFAGATMTSAEDFTFDMTLQLGGERERCLFVYKIVACQITHT